MNFTEREKVIFFLKNAEKNFNVEKWKIDDIEIWPIVKTCIFFSNYKKKSVKDESLKKYLISFFRWIKLDVLYSYFWLTRLKIKKTDYLFSGFFGHRVILENKFYNRYFDPIIDFLEESQKSTSSIFEYEKMNEMEHYREERVFDVTKLIYYFKFKTKKINFEIDKFEKFDELMKELEIQLGCSSFEVLKSISSEFNNTILWRNLWRYILDKTEAKKVFVLCYYNSKMYGLILAAKEKNILSVDMQHGGQGDLHIAYNFSSLPVSGYKLLPDYFWTWDKSSANNILKFTNNSIHKVTIGGNPWIDFLRNKSISLDNRNVILYTLQTDQKPVLHSYIIRAIQNTPKEYIWWLRLHPRMRKKEIEELNKQLMNNNINHKVEIEKANSFPLPLILANCLVHISHFSGSILEADLLNVRVNVIVGEIGKRLFKEILEKKRALYYDVESDEDLYSFIQNGLNGSDNLKDSEIVVRNYRETIKLIPNEESNI